MPRRGKSLKPPRPKEKEIQRGCVQLYESLGFFVYSTSSPFGTAVSPGFPDLVIMHPQHPIFFHEVKREGGRLSPHQAAFIRNAERCHLQVVLGGTKAAVAHLRTLGFQFEGVPDGSDRGTRA